MESQPEKPMMEHTILPAMVQEPAALPKQKVKKNYDKQINKI